MSAFAISFKAKVAKIEEKSRAMAAVKTGERIDEHSGRIPVWDLPRENLGWFIALEGSHESVYAGKEKPPLVIGQEMEVTIKAL